ncbi:photosystem II complex extrinsic protein PsbU [Myxosarcina sp. GI1]|uniref:photosystem II complex extrinsic protein PsbU n=1 Tax=Myxosarcina sp. GI1 TaxID=1541065 RepID=UPI00056C03B7|nr:photosystem II complex extrinsic protein PsbU [Myxosarcina sp. GI1]
MKKLIGIIAGLLLIVSSWGLTGINQAQASELNLLNWRTPSLVAERVNAADAKRLELERGKLDLNNSNIREFRELRGFYPNLASKILEHAPYNNVEDVLDIPGLSDRQKERLQANLDKFIVTQPAPSMNQGSERVNPGLY